ncbi:hypothetical protein AK812_SmicGene34971 [Symbiodinium microadriaticum]|uniref:Uncharacterized protein n=1 Tax=Symbiodinium microadriaticum TaxID=2951 RepID=A0A1Q9CMN4_SYMMI|nr:hypothetical protein AK812_SmicGene34971 [Symbiodinium microadriaticum]
MERCFGLGEATQEPKGEAQEELSRQFATMLQAVQWRLQPSCPGSDVRLRLLTRLRSRQAGEDSSKLPAEVRAVRGALM